MIKTPLLSIVIATRNDQYQKNLLQRLKFILNYFIYSLEKINAVNKVECIIVDWGSKEPLSNYFYKEISKCSAIKFINVPKSETKKGKIDFDWSKGLDLGLNNSSGEHIMVTGYDQFFPVSVFNNLLNLLERPELYGITGNEYKLVPRKFLDDNFFIYDDNMKKIDLYFQKLSHTKLPLSPDFQMNDGSGSGGLILKKKQWLKIGGIKDSNKHNRGQDHVIFHESSEICSHIDTATFGTFLLKLPRTEFDNREKKLKKIKNPLDFLKFDKDQSKINYKNIEIINSLNFPKKRLDIKLEASFVKEDYFTFKEIIKCIIECSIFTVFSKISLKSQDIKFILEIITVIKNKKIKNIIFDESQSLRFMSYIAKCFSDISIFVILDTKKNNIPLDILKLRNSFALRNSKHNHIGHLKVISFDKFDFESLNKIQDCCIIQDFSFENKELPFLIHEISFVKINANRKLKNKTKTVIYDVESKLGFNKSNLKSKMLDTTINLTIHSVKVFFKLKRILGNIKRFLKG
jgi:hypothetical protein